MAVNLVATLGHVEKASDANSWVVKDEYGVLRTTFARFEQARVVFRHVTALTKRNCKLSEKSCDSHLPSLNFPSASS